MGPTLWLSTTNHWWPRFIWYVDSYTAHLGIRAGKKFSVQIPSAPSRTPMHKHENHLPHGSQCNSDELSFSYSWKWLNFWIFYPCEHKTISRRRWLVMAQNYSLCSTDIRRFFLHKTILLKSLFPNERQLARNLYNLQFLTF